MQCICKGRNSISSKEMRAGNDLWYSGMAIARLGVWFPCPLRPNWCDWLDALFGSGPFLLQTITGYCAKVRPKLPPYVVGGYL